MREKNKVLLLIPFLTGYGGTETVINNLLREYNVKNKNIDVTLKVYSLGGYINGQWLEFPNVRVFQLPKNRYIRECIYMFILPFLIGFSILKEKPNIIISTNPIMWSISKLLSILMRKSIKVIAWYHYSYKLKPINTILLNSPDYFLTISKSGKKELENLGIKSNKIFVIFDPIMPTKKIIYPSKMHNRFIYVGRLEYKGQKNISELFKALSLLKNRSWSLRIYGIGRDKHRLQKLSEKLNISVNIKWMGFVNNPLDHVDFADALLLTSTYEGFSMVIAEAIARGLYVISSNCPVGPKELINRYNGQLYKPGDVKELSLLIRKVLNNNVYRVNIFKRKSSISQLYIYNYFIKLISILKAL